MTESLPESSSSVPVIRRRPGAWVVALLVLTLVVLHQDVWNWDDGSLIFGFLPLTLAYHAGISIAASVVWFIATLIAWPVFEEANEAGEGGSR